MVSQRQYGNPANYNITPATRADGDASALEVDSSGNLKVNITAGTLTVRMGGVYNLTQPTLADGGQAETQFTSRGGTIVATGVDTFNVTVNAALPTGANVIGALSANQSVNVAQINGITPLMGNGVTGTGSQRVTIASDNTAFAVNATLSAETTKVIGTINLAAAQTLATVTTVAAVTAITNALPTGANVIGAVTQSGTWTVQPGNTANTTAWLTSNVASASGGYSFLNIAAGQATTTVKSGAGFLHSIVLNSAAVATNTTTIYDNTAASGTVIAIPAVTTATVPTTLIFDIAFATGLTVITAAANGGNMTFCYK